VSNLQLVTLKDMPAQYKMFLLKELGLGLDENNYVTRDGKQVLDKYIEQPIRIDNLAIFPGRSPFVSIASYFDEYGE
jgi:hypothetical protein